MARGELTPGGGPVSQALLQDELAHQLAADHVAHRAAIGEFLVLLREGSHHLRRDDIALVVARRIESSSIGPVGGLVEV